MKLSLKVESNLLTTVMDHRFLIQENGAGLQHVHLFQVHLDGDGEYYMMEQILLDVDMDQIFSQLKQELLWFQKRNTVDMLEDMVIMENTL